MNSTRILAAALAAAGFLGASCGTAPLGIDRRLRITSPQNLATVTPPFTVAWTIDRDLGRIGAFAIFVDVSPMPPGEGLHFFAKKDRTCQPASGCPDVTYLANRGVYLTRDERFRIAGFEDERPKGRPSVMDRHEVTIALVDETGRRIGESAWPVRVFVDRSERSTAGG